MMDSKTFFFNSSLWVFTKLYTYHFLLDYDVDKKYLFEFFVTILKNNYFFQATADAPEAMVDDAIEA